MRLEIKLSGFATALRLLLLAGTGSLPAFPTVIVDYYTTGTASVTVLGVTSPVNASVEFVRDTLKPGYMNVYTWNFQSPVKTDASDISGIDFTVSGLNATAVSSMSIVDRSGVAITSFTPVSGKQCPCTYTTAPGGYASVTNHWGIQANNGWWTTSAFDLSTVGVGGTPVETIIGPPDSNNQYPSANSSVTGNTPILQTLSSSTGTASYSQAVHWELYIQGLSGQSITGVKFNFSTTAPTSANGTPGVPPTNPSCSPECTPPTNLSNPPTVDVPAPEPATLGMIGCTLVGFGLRRLRRRRKA